MLSHVPHLCIRVCFDREFNLRIQSANSNSRRREQCVPALNRAVHGGMSCMFPNEPAQSHCQHHPSCVACVHLTTTTHPSCAVCVHLDVAGADDWEHFTIGGKDYLVSVSISALATASIASPGVMALRTRKQLGIATSIKRPMSTSFHASFHASFSMSIARD